MQFFKLLALAPLAATLVSAIGIGKDAGGLGNAGSLLRPVKGLLRRHNGINPTCDTEHVRRLTDLISVDLDLHVTVDIITEACQKTYQQFSSLSVDVEARADVDFWAQLLVNLDFTLQAALSVYSELQSNGNTCELEKLEQAHKEIVNIFLQIKVVLEAFTRLNVHIQTQLKVHIEAFLHTVSSYSQTCSSLIIGLQAEIQAHIQAIVVALDIIRVNLSINLDVHIGGLLSIGS